MNIELFCGLWMNIDGYFLNICCGIVNRECVSAGHVSLQE